MTYRKKTLRTMSPTARKVARLAGELASIERRLKNLIPELQALEFADKALQSATDPVPRGWEKAAELHVVVDPNDFSEAQRRIKVTTDLAKSGEELFEEIPSMFPAEHSE